LPPLQTVPAVDVGRYLGTWYEIASFPQKYQRGCTATTASYALGAGGDIDVRNECLVDGRLRTARGWARIADPNTNAKLKVSFFRPFWGDYWIVELAPDYSHAVVGHPSRDYLWILSRSPSMHEDTLRGILTRLQAMGYDLARLNRTPQPPEQPPDA
jgi:apolipoprotein D and lipocalin family protein